MAKAKGFVVAPLHVADRPRATGPVVFRTAYGPKARVAVVFPEGTGRTRQSFKAECDINNIMAKFMKTGVLEFTNRNEPRYADVTGIQYQAAMELVASARSMFEELPSALRARFENEPSKFLDFVQDEANAEELVKLGLAKSKGLTKPDIRETMVGQGGSDHDGRGRVVRGSEGDASVAKGGDSDFVGSKAGEADRGKASGA